MLLWHRGWGRLFLWQYGERGHSSAGDLTEAYEDVAAGGQEYVNSGAELDESEMVVNVGVFAGLGIGDYAPGHGAGHLAHRDAIALGSDDADRGAFVLSARFGKISGEKSAAVMLHVFHLSVDGKPVGVNI